MERPTSSEKRTSNTKMFRGKSGMTRTYLGQTTPNPHEMAQALRQYVSRHKGDVWNPPGWVFSPTVTMRTGKAAAFLGVSARVLIRNTDLWGFTVYRTCDYYRYYLISELEIFTTEARKLTASDIKRATKGGTNGIETLNKKVGKRKGTRA